jgi:hypothetical protein
VSAQTLNPLSSSQATIITIPKQSPSQDAAQNSLAQHRPIPVARMPMDQLFATGCPAPKSPGVDVSPPPAQRLPLRLVRAERSIDPRHRTFDSSLPFSRSVRSFMAITQGTHLTYRNTEPTYYSSHLYFRHEPVVWYALAKNESRNEHSGPVAGRRRASVGMAGRRLERVGWVML